MEQRPSEFRGIFQEKSENQKFDLDTRNLKFFKEDIFQVPFRNLSDSSNYKHFKHVFVDEDDYEDFKQDLVNFHHLRSRWKDDRKKVSKERPRINSVVDQNICEREIPIQTLKNSSCVLGNSKVLSEPEEKRTNTLERQKLIPIEVKKTETEKENEVEVKHYDHGDLNFAFKPLPMMEFFQNDEHFQEFDRVFETVKNKRRYASNSSLDKYRWSPRLDGNKSDDEASDSEGDSSVFPELKVDDIFSDFFDNDDDFKNFEQEFENFQIKRRSKALERWHRTSVCDLIEDLKAFCDSDEPSSSNKTSLPLENKLSLPKLWNQGGEWDYIFSKIRRHGQVPSVSSDTGRSDLTVRCDSDSGDCLLDDVSDTGSCRDTGYYSESSRFNTNLGNICSACQQSSDPGEFCFPKFKVSFGKWPRLKQ